MKKALLFLFGLCSGICMVMLWLHRGLILASVKGEPLPKAPKGCPAYKDEEKVEEIVEEKEEEKNEVKDETKDEAKDEK